MTFRTRTFVALLVASTLALAASTVLVTTTMRQAMIDEVEASLLRQVRLAAALLAHRGPMADPDADTAMVSRLVGARVTFILADGTVVGDSDIEPGRLPAVENHLSRPEVQAALRDGAGVDVRRSATTGHDTMYAAAAVVEGPIRFVRIGLPLTGVAARVATARDLLWIGLGVGLAAALLLTWITSAWLSRRVRAIATLAGRYRAGDFSKPAIDFGRDEIGAVARVLDQTARDLGARLEDVARERAHMDAILQGMAEGALLVNAQGRRYSNPAVRTMLRLTGDPQGRHVLEVVRHPDIAAQLTAALSGATPPPAEVQLDRDSRRVFIARVVPVERERGGGAVLVLHDVTELRKADQVRRDFVANVSHELRTPLTAIRGYVEALTDSPGDDPQMRKFLGIIARHAARMERLVTDLLRLARLDARQETIQPAAIPLAPLLAQVSAEMDAAIETRGVSVVTTVPPDAAIVHGDAAKLHDVFRNLLENAINYSPEGGRIEIQADRHDASIVVSVRDRGPGIPEAELSRIFERFYRVDRSRSRDPRDPGGTGLGLSIVKHLVELHGGTVSAGPRDGGGACVTVELPAAPPSSPS